MVEIAVDAADAFPFSDAVNLIGHGLASRLMAQGESRGGRGLPGSGPQNGISSLSSLGVRSCSCGSSGLLS
jgi:hypothetical protein